MTEPQISNQQDEADLKSELSLENGFYAISHMASRGIDAMIESCGYNLDTERKILKGISLLSETPEVLNSTYTGDYLKFADAQLGLECQLHIIAPKEQFGGGYHFAVLDRNQESDNTFFDDGPTIFESAIARDTGTIINPTDIFLQMLYTRCGRVTWNNRFLSLVSEYASEYKPAQWEDNKANIVFKYPAKHPATDPFKNYEMALRNWGVHELYDKKYQIFMRMAQKKTKHVNIAPKSSELKLWGKILNDGLQSLNGQPAH